MIKIYITILLSFAVTSCFKVGVNNVGSAGTNSSTYKTTLVTSVLTDGGGATASMKSSGTTNQLLTAPEGSSIQGSSVTFPPGSLSINTAITIEESASIANAAFTAELNLDTTVSQSGTAVSIKPDQPIDASQPFSLNIPLPVGAGLALADNYTNLVVMYRVTVQASGKNVVGIIPRSDIIIKDGAAQIKTLYFGSFQAAVTTVAVTDKVQADSNTVVLTKRESESLPAMSVLSRSPFIAKANGIIEINGINFRPTMIVALGGKKVGDLKVLSDSKASFVAPSTVGFGLNDIAIDQDGVSQTISIFYAGTKTDLPIMSKVEGEVCAGEKYYDAAGVLKVGTRSCNGSLAACTSEGQINCTATADFPSVAKVGIAAKVISGQTLAGVAGTASGRPANCSVDGQTECVTVSPTYVAAATATLAAKVLSGQTVAGIAGTAASSRPADCAADGQTNCVSVSDFPAVDKLTKLSASSAAKIRSTLTIAGVSGTLADCAGDGAAGCVVVGPTYAAAVVTGIENKIVSGHSVAGVGGNVSLPQVENVLNGINFGVNGSGSIGTATLPPASMVKIGSGSYGNPSAPMTPSYTPDFPAPSNVHASDTVDGVTGTLVSCSSDNEAGCVTTAAFPSVVKANVTEGVIKGGHVIAGTVGQYPNSIYNLSGATPTADLDAATFNIKIKDSSPFEYFDSHGNRHAGNGDSDITATNIKAGFDVFGSFGTYGSSCTSDGEIGCMTTAGFKSVDTSTYGPWDIRRGHTVGGVSGKLYFAKNASSLTTFNRGSGSGADSSSTAPDIYDSIDDSNNGGLFPTEFAPGFNVAAVANFLRDAASDNGAGGGTATDGFCNGSEECIFKDQLTGLLWSKAETTSSDWEAAITSCDNKVYGSYSDWRLATAKELFQFFINGGLTQAGASRLNISSTGLYWSSTTNSTTPTNAWTVEPSLLQNNSIKANAVGLILCVRGI